jgi:hypothetical protein
VLLYDPDEWFVGLTRTIESFAKQYFDPDLFTVEMSFPDVTDLARWTPFAKTIVHCETDDISSPVWAFDHPGVDYTDPFAPDYVELWEAQRHRINFDVGVWASAESGGETSRMRAVQMLTDLFTVPGWKENFNELTGGLWPVSFSGGRNVLDRINDIPVWRTTDMTLVVEAFSRHKPQEPEVIVVDAEQNQKLTVDGSPPPQGEGEKVITDVVNDWRDL